MWREDLSETERQIVRDKILKLMSEYAITSGYSQKEPSGLYNMAVQFENKVFTSASDKAEYLKIILKKMQSIQAKMTTTGSNSTVTTSMPNESIEVNEKEKVLELINSVRDRLPEFLNLYKSFVEKDIHEPRLKRFSNMIQVVEKQLNSDTLLLNSSNCEKLISQLLFDYKDLLQVHDAFLKKETVHVKAEMHEIVESNSSDTQHSTERDNFEFDIPKFPLHYDTGSFENSSLARSIMHKLEYLYS